MRDLTTPRKAILQVNTYNTTHKQSKHNLNTKPKNTKFPKHKPKTKIQTRANTKPPSDVKHQEIKHQPKTTYKPANRNKITKTDITHQTKFTQNHQNNKISNPKTNKPNKYTKPPKPKSTKATHHPCVQNELKSVFCVLQQSTKLENYAARNTNPQTNKPESKYPK